MVRDDWWWCNLPDWWGGLRMAHPKNGRHLRETLLERSEQRICRSLPGHTSVSVIWLVASLVIWWSDDLIGFGLARFPSEYQLDVLLRDRQWCVRTLNIEVLGPLSNPVNGADRPFASGRTLNCYGKRLFYSGPLGHGDGFKAPLLFPRAIW